MQFPYLGSYLRWDVVSVLICSVEESNDLVQGGILEHKHMLRHLEPKSERRHNVTHDEVYTLWQTSGHVVLGRFGYQLGRTT